MVNLIKNDFKVALKMLNNIDPNEHPITEQTIPTIHAVKEVFLKAIEDNLEGMLEFTALSKVLNNKELKLDKETLDWELDTEPKYKEKDNKNLYM